MYAWKIVFTADFKYLPDKEPKIEEYDAIVITEDDSLGSAAEEIRKSLSNQHTLDRIKSAEYLGKPINKYLSITPPRSLAKSADKFLDLIPSDLINRNTTINPILTGEDQIDLLMIALEDASRHIKTLKHLHLPKYRHNCPSGMKWRSTNTTLSLQRVHVSRKSRR